MFPKKTDVEEKRPRIETCIIHCCDQFDAKLCSPKDEASWKSLLNAVRIRKFKPLLDLENSYGENEIPPISYHRQCRSIFTMKRDLDKLSSSNIQHSRRENPIDGREKSFRQSSNRKSRVYEKKCILCQRDKYKKGSRNRENLTQCKDLRADQSIREAAITKPVTRILAEVSRELVAAEAWYHRSCNREYTRAPNETKSDIEITVDLEAQCDDLMNEAFEVSYIRTDLLARKSEVNHYGRVKRNTTLFYARKRHFW